MRRGESVGQPEKSILPESPGYVGTSNLTSSTERIRNMSRRKQYRGHLTCAQIAEGITRATQNAIRLADDAEALLKSDRMPSAVALAILSIEESGKSSILRHMSIATDDQEWQQLWKEYRSHREKNVLWLLGIRVQQGARNLDELRSLVDRESDHPEVLDHLKQLCIYTDCFTLVKWSSPDDIDVQSFAPYLVKMAQILSSKKTVTAQDIELWRKHLVPVKGASLDKLKQAVSAWSHDMKNLDLSEESPNEFNIFLGLECDSVAVKS